MPRTRIKALALPWSPPQCGTNGIGGSPGDSHLPWAFPGAPRVSPDGNEPSLHYLKLLNAIQVHSLTTLAEGTRSPDRKPACTFHCTAGFAGEPCCIGSNAEALCVTPSPKCYRRTALSQAMEHSPEIHVNN